jgi:hypothetical protein
LVWNENGGSYYDVLSLISFSFQNTGEKSQGTGHRHLNQSKPKGFHPRVALEKVKVREQVSANLVSNSWTKQVST